MKSSAREESASYLLEWSVSTGASPVDAVGGEPTLTLDYAITAHEELYVTDRLWVHGEAHEHVPDPYGVYRFVRDRSLRLVFAQAPWPPNLMPHVYFVPYASRVAAGETRAVQIPIALPVDEYSSLARNVRKPTALETVDKVFFILGVRRRSEMEADPSPPPRETAESAGYIVHGAKPIISSCDVEAIPVRRRTTYMARYALPGEPPPDPAPRPSVGDRA